MVSVGNQNQGTDFLMGQAYQARYLMKKNNETFGVFDSIFKMFSSDRTVEITKPSHLPIFLLHKKYVLAQAATTSSMWGMSSSESKIAPIRADF